jgi:hypothetical protein
MKIREFLKKLGGYGSTFIMGITVESYFRGLKKDFADDPLLNDYLERHRRNTEVIHELLEDKIVSSVDKQKIEDKVPRTREKARTSMEVIHTKMESVKSISEQLKDSSLTEETKSVLKNQLEGNRVEIKDQLKQMDDTLTSMVDVIKGTNSGNNSGNKLIDIDDVLEYFYNIIK